MAIREYQGKKITATKVVDVLDFLTIEESLQIVINQLPFTVTMRSPGNDLQLVRGLLHSEGIIDVREENPSINLSKNSKNENESIAQVTISEKYIKKDFTNSRSLLSVSSCGICGKTELDDFVQSASKISNKETIDAEIITHLFDKMNEYQLSFHQSGGTHAAAAFDENGTLICSFEDIGRHNAVDKVIGELILQKTLNKAKSLTVSGRISYEIIVKCFKARIPIIASVSAPSSLSVDFAKELGISLFAFCREGRATCYSHPERIKKTNKLNLEKEISSI